MLASAAVMLLMLLLAVRRGQRRGLLLLLLVVVVEQVHLAGGVGRGKGAMVTVVAVVVVVAGEVGVHWKETDIIKYQELTNISFFAKLTWLLQVCQVPPRRRRGRRGAVVIVFLIVLRGKSEIITKTIAKKASFCINYLVVNVRPLVLPYRHLQLVNVGAGGGGDVGSVRGRPAWHLAKNE